MFDRDIPVRYARLKKTPYKALGKKTSEDRERQQKTPHSAEGTKKSTSADFYLETIRFVLAIASFSLLYNNIS